MPESTNLSSTKESISCLLDEAITDLQSCHTGKEITRWEIKNLGRRSWLAQRGRLLRSMPMADRAKTAKELRSAKEALTAALTHRRTSGQHTLAEEPAVSPILLALIHKPRPRHRRHPVTALMDESKQHFSRLGFSLCDSRQLEDVNHSFDLLGVPPDHATRSPSHTFHAEQSIVLRSHMTASVMRVLSEQGNDGPSRFLVAGPCHRRTVPSRRFNTQFHQLEAVTIGERVRMTDLKHLIDGFVNEVLGADLELRTRFRFLSYVSPGLAVDAACRACRGSGCELCSDSGWLEIMSGGMLTPAVLRAAGCPTPGFRGLALAISVERVLCVKHGIDDIRNFLRNDLSFLAQFT
jgi:phenylalanyl-tRNA synthetase alpha chain